MIRTGLGAAGLGLALLFAVGVADAADSPAPGTEDPNNWPQYHRTYNGWRYSPLDQVNKANVGKLKSGLDSPGRRHYPRHPGNSHRYRRRSLLDHRRQPRRGAGRDDRQRNLAISAKARSDHEKDLVRALQPRRRGRARQGFYRHG